MMNSSVKKCIISSSCAALCLVLSQLLYAVPGARSAYEPIHLPVILCGLSCGWSWGLCCAIVGVAVSAMVGGSPGLAFILGSFAECAVYAVLSGVFLSKVTGQKRRRRILRALIFILLAGRLAGGLVLSLIYAPGLISVILWLLSYLAAGLPGMLINIVLLPLLVSALENAALLPVQDGIKAAGPPEEAEKQADSVPDGADKPEKKSQQTALPDEEQ